MAGIEHLVLTVLVTGGLVRGAGQADESAIFLGIPYAAPPVGELRWQAPAPVVPWKDVRDATSAPAPCLQHDEGWNKVDAGKSREDCLYLSIHTPKHSPSARLPVMFWIHGGSNMAGSGFGYTDSTIHRHGVVLVSIEYRLGVFGFFASNALSAESATHSSGNYGVLDQIAALRWVHENIAQFGGDPGNVTIAGQSAGGYDVGVLMVSPLARGLFHKAIAQSGVIALNANSHSLERSEAIGERFATQAGAPAGNDRLKSLRAMSGEAILAAQDALPRDADDILPPFGQASVDGHVLPRLPREIYKAHEQAHVPLLIGNNTQEFGLPGSMGELRDLITKGFGAKGPNMLAAYGLNGPNDPAPDPVLGTMQMQVLTDIAFRCPANQIAELQLEVGQPVWRYQFGLGRPGTGLPPEHSSELKYVFDAPPAKPDFARWPPVQEYWTNFIRTGDPNGTGLLRWPALGKESSYIDFTSQGPKVGKDLRGEICRVMTR